MIINVAQGEKCKAVLTIEVPADQVTAERRGVTRQFAQYAKVPGYRPGKVPAGLVEKRFASGIREEVEKRLKDEAMKEVREREKLRIISVLSEEATPNVDDTYTVKAEVLLAPEFELPEYKGIPVAVPKQEVREDHLETIIERWKERHADYEEVEEGPLEMGHYAVLDFTATRDGEPLVKEDSPPMFRAFFERKDAWVLMDEESFLPGFCGELLDHKKGESFEFDLTLPAEFAQEELRGQQVHYAVTLKQIMRKTLPEFTDETVKATTHGEFSTAEEFRLDITERLETEMKRYVDGLLSRRVLEYLHGLIDFDLPELMVAQETQLHVNRIVDDSQRQGVDEEALLEKEKEIVEAAQSMGRRDLKTKFILNQIASAEEMKVNPSEINRRVEAMAAQSKMSVKKAMRILRQNGQLTGIMEEVLFRQALAFAKENASVSVDEAQNALDQLWEEEKTAS